jgi:cell division protein FtsQ
MARNQGPPFDDPFYRRSPATRNSFADDGLPLDAGLPLDGGLTEDDEEDEQQQFRRASKRVPVRRGALPRKTASRVRAGLGIVLTLAVLASAVYEVHDFAVHSWRFRVRNIELAGEAPNSRGQVMAQMQELMGRNIFQISLPERKQELEKISWVDSASVTRLWPNRIRVTVTERKPVAFVAIGDRIELIDAEGVVMETPAGVQSNYSFPVIVGGNESDPLSTRAPRMKIYTRLIGELDGGNGGASKAQYSRNLEEVDLSDPEDVKVLTKGGSGPILLHLGNENFLQRFMVFLTNVQKWEQERGKLESVDLRFGREVILNPDMHATAPPPAPEAAKTEAAPPLPAVKTVAKSSKNVQQKNVQQKIVHQKKRK